MAEKYILLLIVTFHPPLKNYYFITSSFGEYRTTHLHLGIDFSTNGKIGIPVYACEDGEIYRIKVSSKGYGKALFLRSNKYIYVYAHLDKFRKDIENFVFKKQLKRKKVELDLFPSKKFKVKEGEIIGYVGETGAGGPHLHFEIRNLYNQALSLPHKILNYRDLNKPVIKGFLIQIDSFNSTIDSFFFDKIISPGETVEVWGNIKISMLAYDREKKTTGISGFEVYLNDKKIKHFFFNKISINNGDFKKNNRIYLTKTNSFARSFIKIGNFRFKENLNKILTIKAIVFDYKGKSDTGKIFIKIRKNKLKFKENYWDLKIKELFIKFFNFGILIGTENQTVASVLGFNKIMNGYAIWLNPKNYLKIYEKDIYILETNKKNKIKFENWEISIEKADTTSDKKIYVVKLDKNKIAIYPKNIDWNGKLKINYITQNPKILIKELNSKKIDKSNSFYTTKGGIFFVFEDAKKPKIYLLKKNKKEFLFKIKDNSLVKVENIKVFIDGKWYPFYYDQDSGKLKIELKGRWKNFKKIEIIIQDIAGNFKRYLYHSPVK